MHTFSETGAGVPAFLAKLWRLVDDPDTNKLICWSKDGRSFIIQNQAQFARELLPLNYKHNNMASFIRQLNMYGFHKITSIDNGGLKFDRDEMEFSHPCFKRNCPYLLEHIKRKIANTKTVDDKATVKSEAVTKVLLDVKAMRGRQDSLDSRFSVMKQENEALWREIASLRQKHAKQQQIVNKLIQFLITIVQPSRNMTSVKRHMQLMIDDTPDNAKARTNSETESDGGPVIHELGGDLLDDDDDDDEDDDDEFIDINSSLAKPVIPRCNPDSSSPILLERPRSSFSLSPQNYDYSNQSMEDAQTNPDKKPKNDVVTEVVYHVTEVPDSQPNDTPRVPPSDHDENTLTTPLVRQEMARTQLLKEKNKQRRKRAAQQPKAESDNLPPTPKVARLIAPQQQSNETIKVKTETDPMVLLQVYPEEPALSPAAPVIPPILGANGSVPSPTVPNAEAVPKMSGSSTTLYNPANFITDQIPDDIFETDTLLPANNTNLVPAASNLHLNNPQQQFQNNMMTGGKFGDSLVGGNNTLGILNANGGASTSAAAAAAVQDKTDNMAVAKYKSSPTNTEDLMRNEVNGHLDNVQDELESLKDILRGEGYSLDANALLGLFAESDLLGSYGLNPLPNEALNDKKGSELMTYQPMYDFSDIMDTMDSNKSDNEDGGQAFNIPSTSARKLKPQNSVLNTPRHE